MRFTFFSAVAVTALVAQASATIVNYDEEDNYYAELDARPAYEELRNELAQAQADTIIEFDPYYGFTDDDDFNLAQLNAELDELNTLAQIDKGKVKSSKKSKDSDGDEQGGSGDDGG